MEEERTLKPSAVGVLQKMLFRCDKQCSEKSLSYWQLASVLIHAGEELYTTNLCQKCFNNSLKANGENMFLSFSLGGWSDRAERWVDARF